MSHAHDVIASHRHSSLTRHLDDLCAYAQALPVSVTDRAVMLLEAREVLALFSSGCQAHIAHEELGVFGEISSLGLAWRFQVESLRCEHQALVVLLDELHAGLASLHEDLGSWHEDVAAWAEDILRLEQLFRRHSLNERELFASALVCVDHQDEEELI